jgi:hypothetical protein
MTPSTARAMYRKHIAAVGETVTLRRGTTAPFIDADVLARVQGYRPEQLVGGITQGSREIIVLAEDLDGTEWPVPPKKGDKVFVRGRQLAVEVVDDSTARISGVIVAYIMTATG